MAIQNSVLTNPGSFVALRNLNGINRDLSLTQSRVSTGLKVDNAVSDASSFAIAQGIRAELRAISAVVQGLNNAKGVGKVALAGLTGVSDLLVEMRGKLTEIANEGYSQEQRETLVDDYGELISQAANFVTNAVFNGTNLLLSATPSMNTLSNLNGDTLTLTNARIGTTYGVSIGYGIDSWLAALATTLPSLRNGGGGLTGPEFAQRELSGEVGDLITYWPDVVAAVERYMPILGAEVRGLELQTGFLETISDATEEGLGNIVDADLARESARLSSLQVQQQLSLQTLSIANQRPQNLFGLFQ